MTARNVVATLGAEFRGGKGEAKAARQRGWPARPLPGPGGAGFARPRRSPRRGRTSSGEGSSSMSPRVQSPVPPARGFPTLFRPTFLTISAMAIGV